MWEEQAATGAALGLLPWDVRQMTVPEVEALDRGAQRRHNLEAQMAAWFLSLIPAAVCAGIGAAFGEKRALRSLQPRRLVKVAPGYRRLKDGN